MNLKKVKIISLLMIFFPLVGFTQDIKFKAESPRVVAVGERFRITYTLNARGDNFQSPVMSKFDILSGPSVSSSSSVQIVNGSMTQSVTNTYTFIVVALEEGKFEIPAASVVVKRNQYNSNPLNIEVVKGNANAQQQNQRQTQTRQNQRQQQTTIPQAEISNEDIFVRVNVSKRNVYQGEHILAIIKVYTKLNLSGFEDLKLPKYQGFWTQEIPTPSQISLQRENVNGQIYNVGVIQKMLLFPQQTGEITIEPFVLDALVAQRTQRRTRSIFDDFFGSNYQNVPVHLESKPVKINVKPLPVNKPDGFSGAIGSMKMYAGIDADSVKANDAITLTVKISGAGNLKLIDAPKIDFPPDFDVYDPKVSTNIKNSESGSSGSKTFEYLFQPRHAGQFRIPSIKFAYFDVNTKKYKTLSTREFNVYVERGNEEDSKTVVTGLSKEDIQFIGSDIRFIKTDPIKLVKRNQFIFGSRLFVLVYVSSLLVFLLVLLLRRNQIKRNANAAQVKNRKANKISKKRLKLAASYMKANDEIKFYDEIAKALWGYVSDKLTIPLADLTKDNVTLELEKEDIENELIDKFLNVLDKCEYARFAPSSDGSQKEVIYKEAGSVIVELERKI
jgi:oxygen tolerance protein BatD